MSNQLLQETEQPGREDEEEEIKKEDEEQKEEADEEPKDENPLEKYMQMVLEARQQQPAQVSCTPVKLCFCEL